MKKVLSLFVSTLLLMNSLQTFAETSTDDFNFPKNPYLSSSSQSPILNQSFSIAPTMSPLMQDTLYRFRTALPAYPTKVISKPQKGDDSLYQTIEKAVSKKKKSVSYEFDKEISAEKLKNISNAALNRVRREAPHYFLNNINSFTYTGPSKDLFNKVTFKLAYFPVTVSQEEELRAEIDSIVSKAPTSTIDKLRYFHDYIIEVCEYNYTAAKSSSREYPEAFNAYGALIEGKAVCQGYAAAFKMLCDAAQIPNWIVTGETDVPHAWNSVNLDGKFYLIDCTKDDVSIDEQRYNYFLAGSDTTDGIYKEDGSAPGELAESGYFTKFGS